MSDPYAHWHNNERRADRLIVDRAVDGWVIIPNDDRAALDICPSCHQEFHTARAAQIVADALYPTAATSASKRLSVEPPMRVSGGVR